MNFAVAASVFGLVAVAELPDKTMIATIVMGGRGRPLPVWIGASVAFAFHAALAVLAGRFLQLLPHRALESVVTAIFGAGPLTCSSSPNGREERRGCGPGGCDRASGPRPWRIGLARLRRHRCWASSAT